MGRLTRSRFLAQLRPFNSAVECPICYEPAVHPFTTTCEHTFCRECLKTSAAISPCCPYCKRVLYDLDVNYPPMDEAQHAPAYDGGADIIDLSDNLTVYDGEDDIESEHENYEDDSESEAVHQTEDENVADSNESLLGGESYEIVDFNNVNDDDDIIDESTARTMALDTGWINLASDVSRENVIDKLTEFIMRGGRDVLSDQITTNSLVTVDYRILVETAVAALLFAKPRRGDNFTLEDTCHAAWEAVAGSFERTLMSTNNQQVEERELWKLLFNAAKAAAYPFRDRDDPPAPFPRYSLGIDARTWTWPERFEQDLHWVVHAIVNQARIVQIEAESSAAETLDGAMSALSLGCQ